MKKFESYRITDEPGHIVMSGQEARDYADINSGKTPEERFKYYKDLSTVFPFMMYSHFYPWMTAGLTLVPDYSEFMNTIMPKWQEKNTPIFEAYYLKAQTADEKRALLAEYFDNFPMGFMEDFFNFYGECDKDFADFKAQSKSFMDEKRAQFVAMADAPNEVKVESAFYFGTSFVYDATEKLYDWAGWGSYEIFSNKQKEMLGNALGGRIKALLDGELSGEEKEAFVLDLAAFLPLSIIEHYDTWVNGGDGSADAGGPGGPPPGGGGPGGPGGPPPGGGGPGGPPPM